MSSWGHGNFEDDDALDYVNPKDARKQRREIERTLAALAKVSMLEGA